MAKTHQRVFALVFALLFLLSTVALSAAVVYTIYQERQNDQIAGEFDDSGGSANNDNNELQPEENVLKGTKLEGFDPISEGVNELKILDIEEGNGEEAKEGATITAHYTGAYAVNGEIFESSKDSGSPLADYPLENLIPGWVQGIPGMKVGGKRRLIIPGNLAYGEAPEGYTPGSSPRPLGTLVFDIELIEVENK